MSVIANEDGSVMRCMMGRYGEYVLIQDLQQMLYKDALKLERKGESDVATYVQTLADGLGRMK